MWDNIFIVISCHELPSSTVILSILKCGVKYIFLKKKNIGHVSQCIFSELHKPFRKLLFAKFTRLERNVELYSHCSLHPKRWSFNCNSRSNKNNTFRQKILVVNYCKWVNQIWNSQRVNYNEVTERPKRYFLCVYSQYVPS